VKIAQAGCAVRNSAPRAAAVHWSRTEHMLKEENMIDFLFTIGQAAAAMLMVYGGMLTLGTVLSRRTAARLTPALEEEMVLFRHLQNDA